MTAIMLATMLGAGVIAWRAGVSAAPYYILAFAGSAAGFIISDAARTISIHHPSPRRTSARRSALRGNRYFWALALGQRVSEIETSAARYEEVRVPHPLTEIPPARVR